MQRATAGARYLEFALIVEIRSSARPLWRAIWEFPRDERQQNDALDPGAMCLADDIGSRA